MTTTRPGAEGTAEPSTRDLYRTAFGADMPEAPPEQDRRDDRAARYGAVLAAALTFIAGSWLVAAPYLLDYADLGGLDGYWNDAVIGGVIAVIALLQLSAPARAVPSSVASAALGAWLIVAPFGLGYSSEAPRASWNEAVTGVVVLILALAGLAFTLGRRANRAGDEET